MAAKDRNRFIELGYKWLEKKISPAEKQELEAWLDEVSDEPLEIVSPVRSDEEYEALLFEKIQEQTGTGRRIRLWPRIAAAASILLVLSTGGYFLFRKQASVDQVARNQKHDITPGRNQATLTLANGQKIVLTKGLSGKLAQQGSTLVQVNSESALAYTVAVIHTNAPVQYNTLSTVRGEQSPYPLVLADGTKVWLNAESSITFPTVFNSKERIVKITGEACFEVTHNVRQPFKVLVKEQTIEDLGTQFNVNAYDNEPVITTTLLAGAVSIAKGERKVRLKPGQQAEVGSNAIVVKTGDPEESVSWKNGYFRFNGEKIESIMRKLSRWYNIDVQYDQVSDEVFYGTISRFRNINEVLHMLEATKGVHFKVEGRRITVIQ